MPTDEESREHGVEFGALADDLEHEKYPIDTAELLDAYGDRKIDLEDGSETVREVLDPLGNTTFDSPDEVMQGVVGMVSDQAIGRKNYTDRGGVTSEDDNRDREQDQDANKDQESL